MQGSSPAVPTKLIVDCHSVWPRMSAILHVGGFKRLGVDNKMQMGGKDDDERMDM